MPKLCVRDINEFQFYFLIIDVYLISIKNNQFKRKFVKVYPFYESWHIIYLIIESITKASVCTCETYS